MFGNKLKQFVEQKYNIEVKSFELLRSYTNEVYLINSSQDKFVLKLYPKVWRTKEEILWEVDLINYLSQKGVPLAKVIGTVIEVSFENKEYSVVLFEYAKGSKPQKPFLPDLQYKVGKAAGLLHRESEGFLSKHKRNNLDLKHLIDDSMLIAEKVILNKEEFSMYREFGLALKIKINTFIEKGLNWGIVHGDLTLDNLHVTENGEIIFYDFDSAGFGFRAIDLYGWVVLSPDKRPNVDAYLKGYQEVRQIDKINIDAAPFLQAALDMWLKEGMKTLNDPKILKFQMDRVKAWAKYFKENNLLELN